MDYKLYIVEIKEVKTVSNREISCLEVGRREACWSPPSNGGFKLNVDAAINKDMRTMDFGAIIRDSKGEFIAALSKKIVGALSPEMAEAKAVGVALSWARYVGINL
ncbi:hypothetical protein TorRG33x02_296490 [Trema orientale]|uniref:RNase H type-1 domain-containing protein n=1 Tax=Trema orientale TaxID=63057 RepID=A0A2P5C5N9_TREOI|nr:hypothetical protein TorRG33x02_296490 [Trema orientale]